MGRRIGFDLLVTLSDDFRQEDEDALQNQLQEALDRLLLPKGVKNVEILTPEPADDVTGENYR